MTKPDGKIGGVDVWVRQHFDNSEEWCIADAEQYSHTNAWVKHNGSFEGSGTSLIALFPTREAALTHLRELEAKEKPVIDLSTAKMGDKFVQQDGSISPPYGCPHCAKQGWHIMQDGTYRHASGKRYDNGSDSIYDLIAPYVEPPAPRKVWVQWYQLQGHEYVQFHDSSAEADGFISKLGRKRLAITELTEGQGC